MQTEEGFPFIDKFYFVNSPEFEPEHHARLVNMFTTFMNVSKERMRFISPTYKHTITDEMMQQHIKEDLMVQSFRKKPLKKSELSLTLNYRAVLEDIVKNHSDGMFVVLESDVFLRENYKELHNFTLFLKALPQESWDLVHIGYDGDDSRDGIYKAPHCMSETPYRKHDLSALPFIEDLTAPQDRYRLIRKFHTRCTDSFVWSYSGIVKFLKHMNTEINYGAAFDYYMINFFENNEGFKHYWSNPSFFIQGSNHGIIPSTL
jgi:hypothetical protein